jgi:FKBP-type peptidyl-prolyl cis-trans isomerase SlyD
MAELTNVMDNLVVSLEYELRLEDGQEVDRTEGDAPLEYLQGHGNIIPGLEKALNGMAVGEEKGVVIPAAEAYGDHDPENVAEFPRETFPPSINLNVGEMLTMQDKETGEPVRASITEVKTDEVVLDFNHPLAGQDLHFQVKIAGLREATSEELEHGHVHNPGQSH